MVAGHTPDIVAGSHLLTRIRMRHLFSVQWANLRRHFRGKCFKWKLIYHFLFHYEKNKRKIIIWEEFFRPWFKIFFARRIWFFNLKTKRNLRLYFKVKTPFPVHYVKSTNFPLSIKQTENFKSSVLSCNMNIFVFNLAGAK